MNFKANISTQSGRTRKFEDCMIWGLHDSVRDVLFLLYNGNMCINTYACMQYLYSIYCCLYCSVAFKNLYANKRADIHF